MAVAAPPRPPRTPRLLEPAKRKVQLWLLVGLLILMLGVAIIAALGGSVGGCGGGAAPTDAAQKGIPADYLALYTAAADKYGLSWSFLAAVGSVESDHGRLKAAGVTSGTNSAGAAGPMQFLEATWRAYGVDGNGDGRKDKYDPEDAIPGAANYLKALGAPKDLRKALFGYNHADWYVDKVLAIAKTYAAGGDLSPSGACSDAGSGDASAQAVYAAADTLDGMGVPYNYGGGHVTPARPGPGSDGPFNGLDCSSSVSWVLQHAGIKAPTLTSGAFMSWGQPGPGDAVTLYTNPSHIIMRIIVNGKPRYFGTSGFGHPKAGTGPAWFTQPVRPGYLAGFVQRHPPGL